jgi:uncharacterized protein (DUF58 family)
VRGDRLKPWSDGALRHQAEELAAVLPPLLVAAERVAATVAQGVHGRRRVGQGETFWQFRRYQAGDSADLIDWRQSGKSQPLFVRETEWEAAESVWLWLDRSPSMVWASARDLPTKDGRAALLLLALAALLVRGGERVALLGSGLAPMGGRGALQRLVGALLHPAEGIEVSLPVRPKVPRHARVVLFGDFLAPPDETRSALAAFAAAGVRGHLLQILDPAEETLPYRGRVVFAGPEGEGDALIGRVETVREDYRRALTAHHEVLAGLARGAGWTFAVHHTDRPPASALLGLFLALAGPAAWSVRSGEH